MKELQKVLRKQVSGYEIVIDRDSTGDPKLANKVRICVYFVYGVEDNNEIMIKDKVGETTDWVSGQESMNIAGAIIDQHKLEQSKYNNRFMIV